MVATPAAPSSTPRSAPIVRTFDDDDHGTDACHAVALGDDGSFVVAGEVQRLAEGRNAWARRYDATGGVDWTYELHTPSEGADAARGVVALDDGGAVLAGEWYSGSPTAQNNFVAQLAGDGAAAWLTEGELDGADDYASVARTATGDLVVAGALGTQAWVRGLAGDGGAMQWEVAQDGATARRAVVAASGDVVAGGASDTGGWVTRYHAQQPVATLRLAAAVDDVAVTCCGTAVVAGGVLAVYDDGGAVQWQTDGTEASWRAVTARADGTLVVAGTLHGDLAVRIYTADGHQLWQGTVAGAAAEAVAANAGGDVVACGSRDGDLLAVKFGR